MARDWEPQLEHHLRHLRVGVEADGVAGGAFVLLSLWSAFRAAVVPLLADPHRLAQELLAPDAPEVVREPLPKC